MVFGASKKLRTCLAGAWFCEVVQKPFCGMFHHIGNDKRLRVNECYWAHFAAEIHLSE